MKTFVDKALHKGYKGIEINLPKDKTCVQEIDKRRKKDKDFIFIAQQVLPFEKLNAKEYTRKMKSRLQSLVSLQPAFINAHTGRDYYSFDDNCRILEVAQSIAYKSGVKIYHETHRGRFSFHLYSLIRYLDKLPELELVADFSHWCTVSESMLQDQEALLDSVLPHVAHIHARIGYEQAPQVNEPFTPEWSMHTRTFVQWWQKIIDVNRDKRTQMTVCPEFGPPPYMPVLPFTQQPVSDQWQVNASMMDYLKERLISV